MRFETAVLVVAGSDSSGGAGITRDIETLAVHGIRAFTAVTAVTVQTDAAVLAIEYMPPAIVAAQIYAALAGGRVNAIKIGMLGSREIVDAVADALSAAQGLPVVLDSVLASSSGGILLDSAGRQALIARLLPLCTLVTPNLPEAAVLAGSALARCDNDILAQAERLQALGASNVLIKGGHGTGTDATDLLFSADGAVSRFASPRQANGMRGTGCALSSAIAAQLARGQTLRQSCKLAKAYVARSISGRPRSWRPPAATHRRVS